MKGAIPDIKQLMGAINAAEPKFPEGLRLVQTRDYQLRHMNDGGYGLWQYEQGKPIPFEIPFCCVSSDRVELHDKDITPAQITAAVQKALGQVTDHISYVLGGYVVGDWPLYTLTTGSKDGVKFWFDAKPWPKARAFPRRNYTIVDKNWTFPGPLRFFECQCYMDLGMRGVTVREWKARKD